MKRLLVAFVMGMVFSSSYYYMTAPVVHQAYKAQVITVHGGDTLWNIASDWSDTNEDVREVIERIVAKNGLSNSTDIVAGQRLLIPVRVNNQGGLMVAEAATKE